MLRTAHVHRAAFHGREPRGIATTSSFKTINECHFTESGFDGAEKIVSKPTVRYYVSKKICHSNWVFASQSNTVHRRQSGHVENDGEVHLRVSRLQHIIQQQTEPAPTSDSQARAPENTETVACCGQLLCCQYLRQSIVTKLHGQFRGLNVMPI